MKTRGNGARPDTPSVETLARQIHSRLNGDDRNGSIDELTGSLTLAANMLARPTAETETKARDALLQLSASQRDALLLHLSGETHVQIAERQGRSAEVVLKELARAYVQLRFAMNPPGCSEAATSLDAEPSVARDESSQTQ
jgi:DNA-directed RNA polymerase specialized sigma24 family protein